MTKYNTRVEIPPATRIALDRNPIRGSRSLQMQGKGGFRMMRGNKDILFYSPRPCI